ncbi:hypothetical protein MNBD_PLANCTO02-1113, partial [hydrothermal vent metagenome]
MDTLIDVLSDISTLAIVGFATWHLFFFLLLWLWSRRDLKRIASSLDEFTRDLKNRSALDATGHLSDQIDAFLSDVNEVLSDTSRQEERKLLHNRIRILDERRIYLHSMKFETAYNMARTMIEAYPLAGVLGTILAIGAALQGGRGEMTVDVGVIVSHFGEAIWSTFAGLMAAILLMFINSLLETRFGRLAENRDHARKMVARAKTE